MDNSQDNKDSNQKEPEGLDQFLASDDPQAAIAGQGLTQLGKQLGQAIESGPAIQNAPMEGVEPESDPFTDLAGGYLGSKFASGAGEILGNELGAVGSDIEGGFIGKLKDKLGLHPDASPEQLQEAMTLAHKAGQLTPIELTRGQQYLNTPHIHNKLNSPKRYADGGMAEPPGLDAFISGDSAAAPIEGTAEGTAPEPEGLNEFIAPVKYGSGTEQLKAGLEGVAKGVAGPLATAAERALGVNPEDIRGREEANPLTHTLGEAAGFVGSLATGAGEAKIAGEAAAHAAPSVVERIAALSQPALVSKAGEAVASKVAQNKMAQKAVQAATEMGLLQTGDEVSKMIEEDPHQSIQTAAANITLSGLMGLAGGAGLHLAGQGLDKVKGAKLIADFRGRFAHHAANPEPVETLTNELSTHYNNIKGMADDVYGPTGLKAQDIEKTMPEMHEGIVGQVGDVNALLQDHLEKMAKKPHSYPEQLVSKLQGDLEGFNQAVSEAQTPADMFNAIQNLKQMTQEYSKFDKYVKPTDEAYDFVRDAKKISRDLRQKLEDSDVWGKAAKRQKDINEAFYEFLPSLKDFEKKFTVEVGGERQIDPTKINTYVNQLGKPNAEIKQQMLRNFLDAADKYQKTIFDTHTNLGLEHPFEPASLANSKYTLEELTPGARLADIFIKNGLAKAGSAISTGVGAAVGSIFGHGAVGAVLGHHVMAPFLNSILPAIAKHVILNPVSVKGLESALVAGEAAAKGEALLNRAAKGMFGAGSDVLPKSEIPTEKDRKSLQAAMKTLQDNPNALDNLTNNHLDHYMPGHAAALTETISNALTYLNAKHPMTGNTHPLDAPMPMSPSQKAEYNNVLNLAQQPLLIMNKVKDGTLTPDDIMTVKSIYPKLYDRMVQKVSNEMMDAIAKGKTIPYKTRIGMSLFMTQPLDGTMTPMAIQAAQQVFMGKQQQSMPQGGAPHTKHGTSTLGKMNKTYQTDLQSREASRLMKR